MSRRGNKRKKNGQLSPWVLLNNPYNVGAVPTPRVVKVLRREGRKIAREIISSWNRRIKRE